MKAKTVAKQIPALAIAVIVASLFTNTACASSSVFHMSMEICNWRGEVEGDEVDALEVHENLNGPEAEETIEPLDEIVPADEATPEDDMDLPEEQLVQDKITGDEITIIENDMDESDHTTDLVGEANEVGTVAPDNTEDADNTQDKTPALTESIDETEGSENIIKIGDEEDDHVDTYTLEPEE